MKQTVQCLIIASLLITTILAMPQILQPKRRIWRSTNNSPDDGNDRTTLANGSNYRQRRVRNSITKHKRNNSSNNRNAEVHRFENGTLKILNHRGMSDIVFPEDTESRISAQSYDVKRRPCGGNKPFCEDVDDYVNTVNINDESLRRSLEKFKSFFGDDEEYQGKDVEIGQRIDADFPMDLCISRKRLTYPKFGINKNQNWLQLVNLEQPYKQGIYVEECLNEGQRCQHSDDLALGYETRCEQKYIYRKAVALDSQKENKTFIDDFQFPSCCVCKLIRHERSARSLFITDQTPVMRRKRFKKFE